MSTRAQISIKQDGREVQLYHHHDGYPKEVGADLKKRLGKLNDYDWYINNIANNLIKDTEDEYELITGFHNDIEYVYEIDCDNKALKCWKAANCWDANNLKEAKGREIDLDAYLKNIEAEADTNR